MGITSSHNVLLSLPRRVNYGWWVLLVTALAAFFATGSSGWTFTVMVKPMALAFESSHSQVVGVLAWSGILSALLAPLAGRIVDRHGARVVLTVSLIILGFMTVLSSRTSALWQFYLIFGIGLAASQSGVWMVGAQAVAANWFIRKRGIAFGTIATAMAVAGVFFSISAQEILDRWDWRMVWLIIGLAIIVIPVPLVWLVVRRRPEDMGLRPDGDVSQTPTSRASEPQRHSEGVGEVSWTLSEAARTRTFWILNASLVLIGFPAMGVIIVMHPYFTDLGVSSGTAARLVSFYALCNTLGALVWAGLIQLLSVRALLAPFAMLYGASIALMVWVGNLSSVTLLFLSMVPLGIVVMGTVQLVNQVWADYYGRQQVGSILGVSSLIRTVSMAFGPLIAAGIHDSGGSYGPAFVLFAVFCFVAGVGLLFAKPPRKLITA